MAETIVQAAPYEAPAITEYDTGGQGPSTICAMAQITVTDVA